LLLPNLKRPFENCEDTFIYFNPTQYLKINTNKDKRLNMSETSNTSTTSSTKLNISPSFSSCHEEEEEEEEEEVDNPNHDINTLQIRSSPDPKLTTTPCHSLLLTSSSSTSSLCSSSKNEVKEEPTTSTTSSSSSRHSYLSQTSSSSESISINSSLQAGNVDVELLLSEMVSKVESMECLKNLFEKVASISVELLEDEVRDVTNAHLCQVKALIRDWDTDFVEKNNNIQVAEIDDNTSFTVMLDDVLQYFDFLNMEKCGLDNDDDLDEDNGGDDDNNADDNENNDDGEDEVSLELNDEEKRPTNWDNCDLNQVLIIHLNRLWGILDVSI
jgi:hypothetical protein